MKNTLCNNERRGIVKNRRRRESFTGLYHVVVKGINKERIFDQQREKVYLKKFMLIVSCLIMPTLSSGQNLMNYHHLWPESWQNTHFITILSTIETVMFFRIVL